MVELYSVSELFRAILVFQITHIKMSVVDFDQSCKILDRDQLIVDNWQVFLTDSQTGAIGFLDQCPHCAILVEPNSQV